MGLHLKSVLTAAGLTLFPASVYAETIPDLRCKTYYEGEPAPKPVAAFLKAAERYKSLSESGIQKNSNAALTQCQSKLANIAIYTLKMPIQHDAGVCHFLTENVDRFFSKEGAFLGLNHPRNENPFFTRDDPRLLSKAERAMFMAEKNCPKQGDGQYSGTRNISPGVFRSLAKAYMFMTASDANLLSSTRLRAGDASQTESYQDFRLMLKSRFGHAPMLASVGFEAGPLYERNYTINISAPDGGHGWILSMELEEDGWKLVNIASWIA